MSESVGLAQIWSDRALAWRDRLLVSTRFQRIAARIPGAKTIARRRARQVFDLCAGFVYSQILLASVRLGLLEALAKAPADADSLARHIDLSREATERLLKAGVALRLIEHRSRSRYGLGPLGAAVVGNPAVTSMIDHHQLLYEDLFDPIALLRGENRTDGMARYWPYARSSNPRGLGSQDVADYSRLMSASQSLIADQVLDAYPIASHRKLLDVGGGLGTFLAAAAARAPGLRLALFDLPAVVERARIDLVAHGLADRTEFYSGDFFEDALPRGADLITVVRILHDHDEDRVRRLLCAIRSAIAEHGTLLVAEPMAETPGAEPIGDAYFAFYLLAMGSGRARTKEELQGLLEQCGFGDVRSWQTTMPLQTRLLSARPVSTQ